MSSLTINKENATKKSPRVFAITGGKGGVGKTSLSINLSIALSRNGSKVCLFDADTGLANINIMLGLHPAYTLEHLFTGEKSIQDIVIEGPEGIHIVPGASGFAQCVELDVGQQQRLVTSIQAIEPHYDYMVVDTAAGISPTVLHFIAASQVAVIVVTPEPTSLTDAFSLVKVLKRRGYRRKVQVIVNMSANSSQAEKVFRRFSNALDKYLSLKAEYLGSVWMDESMRSAVSLQRPVALFPRNDPSARSFYRLADRIDEVFSRPGVPTLAFSSYWQKLVEAYSLRKQAEPPVPNAFDARRRPVQLVSTDAPESSKAKVFDIKGQHFSLAEEVVEVSQVQKQQQEKEKLKQLAEQVRRAQLGNKLGSDTSSDNDSQPLSADSENNWIDLRVKMSQFIADPNTTPEQVTTILSSCIFGYGERLGAAAHDLMHGLFSLLQPEMLNDEQRLMLRSEVLRLGVMSESDESIEVSDNRPERYDESGFGCQKSLANTIRSASDKVPLESLLESIKYASLVDKSTD
jgi:MinD-like ATPase involved in chromosome partitioning or flagellar assembly